jgi:RNA polymerase sigma factor (sigma-70 family)
MKFLRDGTDLRHLSALFNEGLTGAVTDGQLLERFATRRGEASEDAFAALVDRHGPVVLRLCRSILRDEHEAQDAFQATFLVLAQRAGSLWVRDSIGPWIHSVAYRVASCARAAAIRRQRHERRHAQLAGGRLTVYPDDDRGDLDAVVHEEIVRLPEHYRAPLVLCDLEGCSHEQAARTLGWPVGTVKSRQARGRRRLRERLIRRGLAPSPGWVLGAALAPEPPVPAALTKATANLATNWAGADSARIAVLAREVLKVMFLRKLKVSVLWASMITLAAAGAGAVIWLAAEVMPRLGQAVQSKPGEGQGAVAAKQERTGRIYITVSRADPRGSGLIHLLMALDPETGARSDVFEGCSIRPRVSPDGQSVAFEAGDGLWVRGLDPKAGARKIAKLGGSSFGSPPVWSPDGKQVSLSLGHREEPHWVNSTRRVNVDGTGWEELPIPQEDTVQDWSSDGQWLLTASPRNATMGWQLYVMRPDGNEQRRITDGGNPFYARFSPDGRRVLYSDNGRGDQQSGIWVVDVDGKNSRLVFPAGGRKTTDSACWSPDGKRIAIILAAMNGMTMRPPAPAQVVVMDLDGGHRSEIFIPEAGSPDMPDWR